MSYDSGVVFRICWIFFQRSGGSSSVNHKNQAMSAQAIRWSLEQGMP